MRLGWILYGELPTLTPFHHFLSASLAIFKGYQPVYHFELLIITWTKPLTIFSLPMPDGFTPVSLRLFDSQITLIASKYTLKGVNVLVHCRGESIFFCGMGSMWKSGDEESKKIEIMEWRRGFEAISQLEVKRICTITEPR